MPLFILVVTIFRWFSNVNLESSMMPRCFCYTNGVITTLHSSTLREDEVVFLLYD